MDLEKFAKALNDKFGQIAEVTNRGTIIIRNGEDRLELDGYGNVANHEAPAAQPAEPAAPAPEPAVTETPGA